MVTTNANDSRPRDNHGRDAKTNSYRPKEGRDSKPYNSNRGNFNNKPYNKEERENRPYNKDGRSAGPRNNRPTGGYKGNDYKRQDYKDGGGYNKDRDDNDGRRNKSYGNGKDQRVKNERKTVTSEQQPDKFETIKRLEKEKKVIQKKQENSKKPEKANKPQVKQKRSNNIDWTKGYENGLYDDDDEDYTLYL